MFDGHGSVRALTNASGAVSDTYDYDAFGNLIHSSGTTPNNYLFAGEQFDPDLGLYYNRARYLNVSTGRFWSMDTFEGDDESPFSLHKYLYAAGNPVDSVDPTGHDDLTSIGVATGISTSIGAAAGFAYTKTLKGTILGAATGGTLGFAHFSGNIELISRVLIGGLSNAAFQAGANYLSQNYFDPPNPIAPADTQLIVEAFEAGTINSILGPTALRVPGLQNYGLVVPAVTNALLTNYAQGKSLREAIPSVAISIVFGFLGNQALPPNMLGEFGMQSRIIARAFETVLVKSISTLLKPVVRAGIKEIAPEVDQWLRGF